MKEHPILFGAPMVRAILDGTKTQTRRLVSPQPNDGMTDSVGIDVARFNLGMTSGLRSPYGEVGDRLWYRESFVPRYYDDGRPAFMADWTGASADVVPRPRFKPGVHMPRALCRIDLDVIARRVEHLQDITEADIRAEGMTIDVAVEMAAHTRNGRRGAVPVTLRSAWAVGWDAINASCTSWASNPWVWVVSFKRAEAGRG